MPAIAAKHSAVRDALCSGIGARLIFMDATIMCRNLSDLNREGILALPINDSVIVEARNESKAFEIMERNLALKADAPDPQKSTRKSTYQIVDTSDEKSPPHLNTHLHNGHSGGAGRVVVAWAVPPVPSWVVALPAELASLAGVAWFYGAGELRGYEASLN